MLDAFEVTIVNNVISTLRELWRLTSLQASWILSIWFVGIMVGAYLFGYLADRFGRRKVFLLTLLMYGFFTFLTAFASGYFSFMALRLLAAIGVGAEYAAINAAISEFIPARHRGKTNATVMNFWSVGAILAALVTLYLLNNLPHNIGCRAAFGFGALIALCTGLVRRYIPESPRWLVTQGNRAAAESRRLLRPFRVSGAFHFARANRDSKHSRSASCTNSTCGVLADRRDCNDTLVFSRRRRQRQVSGSVGALGVEAIKSFSNSISSSPSGRFRCLDRERARLSEESWKE